MSTSQNEFLLAPVAEAPKELHSAWVIERGCLSALGDETEAEALDVAEARFLKLLDPHTERELPNAEAIIEGGSTSSAGSRPRGWNATSRRRVARLISLSSSRAIALLVFEKNVSDVRLCSRG